MRYRSFGSSGLQVSEVGFGGWGIGDGWGQQDDAEACRALQRALDLGLSFFDTARAYGNGHSEELLGRALRNVRSKVVIATKIAPRTMHWPVPPQGPVSATFPAGHIIRSTEESLRALGSDYIDIQQLHAWTPAYLGQLEWHEALTKLKQAGKVRAFGVSVNDWDPYGGVELVKSGLIQSVQVIYNIFEQRPAEQLLPAALENKVGVIVRVPFEEGLLTGGMGPGYTFAHGDWRAQWLTPERRAQAAPRVESLKQFLAPDRPTLAALALKFCLSHPAVSTVIPGMRRAGHVDANCAASDGVPLSQPLLDQLRQHAFVHGWAYPWIQK